MAEVAVPRQMFAHILSLDYPAAGTACFGMMNAGGQMQQTTVAEVRPDPDTAARFSAAERSNWRF